MSWKDIVKSIAPVLGTALGGPMAGTAIKMLAGKFLDDDNAPPAQLEKQLAGLFQGASPELLLKTKELDNDFEKHMADLGVDVFKLEVADRDSARTHNKDSVMPAVIVLMLTIMVSAGAYSLMVMEIPDANSSILYMLFGQVLTAWGASIAYWVGTTKSSSDKSKMIGITR